MTDKEYAITYLRKALNSDSAEFRDGQWESIEALLNRKRLLVVERTGWGKSIVYFIAARLLRDKGYGPALLISPLLSLIRNQLEAAEKIGLASCSINSATKDEWENIYAQLKNNMADILLISPERLSNQDFREQVLPEFIENISLIIVDEAHCISDWGHDFRPDYRRIARIIEMLPSNIPVLGTTATANNRVIEDIRTQLGKELQIQRGSLVRSSLILQNIIMLNPAERLAWLAETIPQLKGSGIVYVMTRRDSENVAAWLQLNDIAAMPYHSYIEDILKVELEHALIKNEIKVLVATVALGMGFDKPDIGFVIHYQRPASVIHYYQQVGRAGRALDTAYAVLLHGKEDDRIAEYFQDTAFPPQKHVDQILSLLRSSKNGLSYIELQSLINLPESKIEKTLKFLLVESPSPITKINSKWYATPEAEHYVVNQEYINKITGIRQNEQEQMKEYMQYSGCLMNFLQNALSDTANTPCGRCQNCNTQNALNTHTSQELIIDANIYLKRRYVVLMPRRKWPAKNIFSLYNFGNTSLIPPELIAEYGRTLCMWQEGGWGEEVKTGKYNKKKFSDKLLYAVCELFENWKLSPFPTWITCLPSSRLCADSSMSIVEDFARRFGKLLGIPFVNCVKKIKETAPQKSMQNSWQQVKNLDGAFQVMPCPEEPCFLFDDIVNSGWTMTIVSALLRQNGVQAVYPLALAKLNLKD